MESFAVLFVILTVLYTDLTAGSLYYISYIIVYHLFAPIINIFLFSDIMKNCFEMSFSPALLSHSKILLDTGEKIWDPLKKDFHF